MQKVVLRKTSLIDYSGILSTVIFFPGCNLRCPWCHNRELVVGTEPDSTDFPDSGGSSENGGFKTNTDYFPDSRIKVNTDYITLDEALAHLEKRRTVLGGVVLSGGEPTLFAGLGGLVQHIKSLGIKVKLDTNGTRPDVLEVLFTSEETRPDYIAMDLKIAPERYGELLANGSGDKTNSFYLPEITVPQPGEALKRSAALIRSSGIAHEFRSLSLPEPYFGGGDRAALAALAGDSPWHMRPFVPGNCLDPAWDFL